MEPSTNLFNLIRLHESSNTCDLKAYLDTGGVPTIGWGTTRYPNGKAVKMGDTCTVAQADEWMANDVKGAVAAVNRLVKVKLTQEMFDALVDFTYNIGEGRVAVGTHPEIPGLATSTLLRLLNQGQYQLAAQQFPRWNKDNGKVQGGLVKRRADERKLFEDSIPKLEAPEPTPEKAAEAPKSKKSKQKVMLDE